MDKRAGQRKGGGEDSAWVYGLSNWKNGGSMDSYGDSECGASVEG